MKNKYQIFTGKIINDLFFIPVLLLLFFINSYAQNAAVIDLDSTHQMIRGFGAANILQWRPDMTADEIDKAFGTDEGQIGLTILRLRIPPDQNSFSSNISTAQAAHSYGVKIIASPWSPPAWMKTNNNLIGGELDELYYEDYAQHLLSFVDLMEINDVPIYAVSVQNEPDASVGYESCDWNATQMLNFMKNNAAEIGTRVMMPESQSFNHSLSDPTLNDSAAAANVSIIAGHIYGGGAVPYPLAESKGKEIWMTEHYTDSQNSGNLWPMALDVGTDIHHVMTAGMNAYIWWYIVRYYGPISDGTNNSGSKGDVTKRGFIMSQYSRFIRPGYFRIQCDRYPQSNVFASAYIDSTSSKVVIVAINTASQAKNQTFTFENGTVEKFIPYVTSETKNCSQESDIFVSNGSFSITLDGESVTTFVSSGNVIVAVENSSFSPVTSFKLFQNYPNPFNPSTQINFEIPEKSFVSLKVYNILGQEIAELVGKEYLAGVHSVIFDASHLANGIYFYTLKTRDFTKTRKMFIIK
jgi:glucuronoarabinoxylan endo-1,4-beta-xylanase